MINSFRGKYAFLSNFYPCRITLRQSDGSVLVFPSSEHAFMAHKTLDLDERRRIAALPTPGQAKRAGRNLALRPDWDDIRIDVMRAIVEVKFKQNANLLERLLATGDEELVEGNTWGDRFWGTHGGFGENWLGKILAETRDRARAR